METKAICQGSLPGTVAMQQSMLYHIYDIVYRPCITYISCISHTLDITAFKRICAAYLGQVNDGKRVARRNHSDDLLLHSSPQQLIHLPTVPQQHLKCSAVAVTMAMTDYKVQTIRLGDSLARKDIVK